MRMSRLALALGLVCFPFLAKFCSAEPVGQGLTTACGYGSASNNSSLSLDGQGSLCTRGPAATVVVATSAVASNQVLKALPGFFWGAQVNTTSAAEFVMLFDATALPANGAVTPVAVWQVPANTTIQLQPPTGVRMFNGITLGCSTTGPYTLTASALCGFSLGVVQ